MMFDDYYWKLRGCKGRGPMTRFWNKQQARAPLSGHSIDLSMIYRRAAIICRHAALACSAIARSEEHTSELQSHLNLVCRLLLEKKNTFSLIPHAHHTCCAHSCAHHC